MANLDILQTEEDLAMYSSLFGNPKAQDGKARGLEIEAKIEFLESLAGTVSNRRSRRWLNDRLLMELVPRLNAEEIRGLFAPPPWGDEVPPSAFSMTSTEEWDSFRNIDMDKEFELQDDKLGGLVGVEVSFISFAFPTVNASIIKSTGSSSKSRGNLDADKVAVIAAWHRVDSKAREALRRCFLSDIISGYEECLRAFIMDTENGDILELHVQDPFHRLLLHGVSEFYNLVSTTVTQPEGNGSTKMTRIRKKKSGSVEMPNITLCNFLKMAKEGFW